LNKYFIKSIPLASWLVANDFELLSTEKNQSGKHLFWFEESRELHDSIDSYFKQETLQRFLKAQIKIKKIVFPKPATSQAF